MKKLKALIVFLLLVIVALGVFVFLLATGKVSFVKTECNCKESTEVKLDVSKLEAIKSGEFNILKQVSSKYFPTSLLTNGKVMFGYDRYISNVDNAKDIVVMNEYLYILTEDGNVYKYFAGITNNTSLEATKIEDLKDIKMMFEYDIRSSDAGGCNYLIVVDKDNNYKQIDELCI